MKKQSKRYDSLVKGYYIKPKSKSGGSKPSLVITKSFDDGKPVINISNAMSMEYDLAWAQQSFTEYDLATIPDEGLSDYQLVSTEPKPVMAQSNDIYIESFGEMMCKDENAVNSTTQPVKQEGPQNEALAEAEKLRKEALESVDMPDIPQTPSVSLGKAKPKITDDDFMADMQSILTGKKMFDPVTKRTIDKNQSAAQSQPQPAARQKEEDVKPLETKNEHAIFDKIAQNMRYANTFDLGSFDIEQRFDDFDKMEEIKERTKKISKEKSHTPTKTSPETARAGHSDFIEDLDIIAKEQKASTLTKKEKEIPLDPGVGGRSIALEAMQPGDIIISTTDSDISSRIRKATNSEVGHSAVYIGNGNVIEAIDDGVMQFTVETSISQDSVSVAYRHKEITPDKAAAIVAFLEDAKNKKLKFDYYGLIRVAPYQLISNYCESLPTDTLRSTCRASANAFKLGTDNHNEFYCSELVFAAFKNAGLNISDVDPHWSSPQDVVRLNHNGTLQYVGHLKA